MINKNKLEDILKHCDSPAVSIVIPTKIAGDYEVNRIRWKNELSEVYKKLEKQSIEKTSFLKQADELLDNSEFWANQSSGLAGYFSKTKSEIINLVDTPKATNVVHDKFLTTPILLSKINKQRVFLLTLSQNEVRFFEAVNSGIFPVKINDLVPPNKEEALYLDVQKETLKPTGHGLSSTNHFKDKSNIRIEQYFKMIDDGLWPILEGEKVPLVIGAVEEHHSVYRKLSRYKHISSHMLMGNTDDMSPAELRLQLDPVFKDIENKEKEHLDKLMNQDYEKKNIISNVKDLMFNLEIDNIEICIIPAKYSTEKEEQIFQIEEILRTCYSRNIDVCVREDYDSLTAISRNEVVIHNN